MAGWPARHLRAACTATLMTSRQIMGPLSDLPLETVEVICHKLPVNDLARFARVCRDINTISTPILYRTIHFRLPGSMSGNDALLAKLETFTDPGFDMTKHTINVVVSGTWYIAYEDVESALSQVRVLSPAVRMLNSLIITCLIKMPLLRTFTWDAQVTPTQRLISNLSTLPSLETLQLRLATDDTPNPYFHPLLRFQSFLKLVTLNLVQIDKADILESIGSVLGVLPCLSVLRICADVDAGLSLETLFANHPPSARFRLVTLDLRGFSAIYNAHLVLWDNLQSEILRNLTVELCGPFDEEENHDFWLMASASGLQLSQLSTNLVTNDIATFLNSFSGLRSLHLTFNCLPDVTQPLPAILEVISSKHSDTLEVLALLSRGLQNQEYLLPERMLEETALSLPQLKEFSFAIDDEDIDNLSHVINLPRLRTLHVRLDINLDDDELNELVSQIRSSISAAIEERDSSRLEYVAINEGPLYRLTRNPLRWHIIRNHLGRMPGTELFQDVLDDWVEGIG